MLSKVQRLYTKNIFSFFFPESVRPYSSWRWVQGGDSYVSKVSRVVVMFSLGLQSHYFSPNFSLL